MVKACGNDHTASDDAVSSAKTFTKNYAVRTITFDANGGSVTPSTIKTDTSGWLTADLPTPTRTNYTFVGWTIRKNDGPMVNNYDPYLENTTLYAKWTFGPISHFAISGITEPVAGEAPDSECLIPVDCGYRPTIPNYGYVNWYTEDGDLMNPDTDTFTEGKRYSAQVTLIPTEGYEFAASGLTGTMNGKDATASIFIASPKKKINMSRWFTCSAASVGNTVSGTIKSYLDNAGAVKVTLANRSNSTIGFTKTVYGNSASFSFSDVPSGLYLLTLSKANHVSKSVTVAVTAGTPELKCQINPIGDVDNNGRVNAADAKAVSRHANEQEPITDSYKLKCADVTAPKNNVNSADAKAILQHANEQKSLWQ